MRNSAAIVLTVFCALLSLQLCCTAGWLSHCDEQEDHQGHSDLCSQDLCSDDFALPGKLKIKQINPGTLVVLADQQSFHVSSPSSDPSAISPVAASSCSRPSGSFPLLI